MKYSVYVSSRFTPQEENGRYRQRQTYPVEDVSHSHHYTSIFAHDNIATTTQYGTINRLKIEETPLPERAKMFIHYSGSEPKNLHLHFFPEANQTTVPLTLSAIRVVDVGGNFTSPYQRWQPRAPHHSVVVHLHEARNIYVKEFTEMQTNSGYEGETDEERKVVDIYGREAQIFLD